MASTANEKIALWLGWTKSETVIADNGATAECWIDNNGFVADPSMLLFSIDAWHNYDVFGKMKQMGVGCLWIHYLRRLRRKLPICYADKDDADVYDYALHTISAKEMADALCEVI